MNTTGKKFGGRKKGTPNKLTAEVRELIADALSGELDKLPETLQQLDPKDRLMIVAKLLPFIIPKCQDVSIETPKKELNLPAWMEQS